MGGRAAVQAAVRRITDNRMTDRAEMHPDLVRTARRDGHFHQRHAVVVPSKGDPCDGVSGTARTRRHFLPVSRIPSDRGVDPAPRLYEPPHKRDELLVDFAIAE